MNPAAPDLPGRADVLDYFSLLLAQMLGCAALDFGLSRPHLDDGAFRYKAKWGARVQPQDTGPKTSILIAPLKRTEATLAVLRRNLFLQRSDNGLLIRVLYDQAAAASGSAHADTLRRAARYAPVALACSPDVCAQAADDFPDMGVHPICRSGDPFSVAYSSP